MVTVENAEGDSGKCYEFKKVAEGVGQAEAATACSNIEGGWKLIGEDALKSGNSEWEYLNYYIYFLLNTYLSSITWN